MESCIRNLEEWEIKDINVCLLQVIPRNSAGANNLWGHLEREPLWGLVASDYDGKNEAG